MLRQRVDLVIGGDLGGLFFFFCVCVCVLLGVLLTENMSMCLFFRGGWLFKANKGLFDFKKKHEPPTGCFSFFFLTCLG